MMCIAWMCVLHMYGVAWHPYAFFLYCIIYLVVNSKVFCSASFSSFLLSWLWIGPMTTQSYEHTRHFTNDTGICSCTLVYSILLNELHRTQDRMRHWQWGDDVFSIGHSTPIKCSKGYWSNLTTEIFPVNYSLGLATQTQYYTVPLHLEFCICLYNLLLFSVSPLIFRVMSIRCWTQFVEYRLFTPTPRFINLDHNYSQQRNTKHGEM